MAKRYFLAHQELVFVLCARNREGNYSPKGTPILSTLADLSTGGETQPPPELEGTQVIPHCVITSRTHVHQ